MSEQVAASVQSEQAVLGSMLLNPRCITEVGLYVQAGDFYRPAHEEIFTAIVELHETGGKLDPLLLVNHLQSRGRLVKLGGAPYIHTLIEAVTTTANVGHYAQRVRELSRVRRWRANLESGLQAVADIERGYWASKEGGQDGEVDIDRMGDRLARIWVEGELLLDEKLHDAQVEGLSTWSEFLSVPPSPQQWVVRDLFERKDVWMILGGEGGGKSWFDRQMCLTIAAGIHPFRWDERIEPQTTLLIDLENAQSMVRRQSYAVHRQALMHSNEGGLAQDAGKAWIWTRPEGLNLRQRADQLIFERVVEQTRPAFIGMGSLYNAFKKGRDDWETAAEDVKEFLNKIRTRYDCAIMLEHHMPKGSGQHDRPETPYGSSVWMRWVTHGYVINRVGPTVWEFSPFRGDRDERSVPAGLTRGGLFPWNPVWDEGDIDAMLELDPPGNDRRRH